MTNGVVTAILDAVGLAKWLVNHILFRVAMLRWTEEAKQKFQVRLAAAIREYTNKETNKTVHILAARINQPVIDPAKLAEWLWNRDSHNVECGDNVWTRRHSFRSLEYTSPDELAAAIREYLDKETKNGYCGVFAL
jgi:uncharacterized protein (DUF2164 family)